MEDDDATSPMKRRMKWKTPYSQVTQVLAEKRLGLRIGELKGIPVGGMMGFDKYKSEKELSGEDILKIKDKVYGDILQFLDTEGYPTEGSSDFINSNVSNLVVYIIGPILAGFWQKTGRHVRLHREKEIVAVDNEMGGKEEFVIVDLVDVGMEGFVLIVEGERSSLGQAKRQYLLSL